MSDVQRYELTIDGETFPVVRASEYEALEDRLDDYLDDYTAVINEVCAGDEQHCTCVPILRIEIERLRGALQEWQGHHMWRRTPESAAAAYGHGCAALAGATFQPNEVQP